jgi:hypothetical protein
MVASSVDGASLARVRIYIYRETDGCDGDRDRCACTASSAAKGRVLGGLEEFIDAEQPLREETPSALEVRFYVARACVRVASRTDDGF